MSTGCHADNPLASSAEKDGIACAPLHSDARTHTHTHTHSHTHDNQLASCSAEKDENTTSCTPHHPAHTISNDASSTPPHPPKEPVSRASSEGKTTATTPPPDSGAAGDSISLQGVRDARGWRSRVPRPLCVDAVGDAPASRAVRAGGGVAGAEGSGCRGWNGDRVQGGGGAGRVVELAVERVAPLGLSLRYARKGGR